MEQKALDEKINDAACKAEQVAALVQCIENKVRTYNFDFKLEITGALQGVISLCEYLQRDLNELAEQAYKSMSV